MDIEDQNKQLIPTSITSPRLFIYIGFTAGLVIWFVDALIDVYIIDPDESLIEDLIFAEGTELWMRVLILIVMTAVGIYASLTFRKSLNLNILLYKYQFELEELVRTRTLALEEKSDQLEKLANTDPLTEIYNRRKFIEVCEAELNRFIRHQHPFSIFMIDIDDFKLINDSHGHDVGDNVIKQVAEIIRNATRGSDYFARWGGEEFIIMSPESDFSGREVLAEKIVSLVANHKFEKIGKVTISVGLTSSKETDKDLEQIFKRADNALYQAKNSGKNQYQIEE